MQSARETLSAVAPAVPALAPMRVRAGRELAGKGELWIGPSFVASGECARPVRHVRAPRECAHMLISQKLVFVPIRVRGQ